VYTKDVINTAAPTGTYDVFAKPVSRVNADSYNTAAPTGTYDVFAHRQWYHKVPPVAAGGDQVVTITTAQGGQTTDITATLAYMAGIETGQGSQTTNGVLSGDTPTPPVIIGGGGDGFVRRGNLLTYVRPKDLEPDVALNRVVKRVAKRLKIKRVDARYLVEWAQQAFTALPEYRPAQNLALSAQNDGLERRQVAQIKAYWAALEQAAIEQAEEDEEILLWLS
jgi:hypothetical protein